MKPTVHSPRIFVRIAAYRDMECLPTLLDLFEKAKRPDRVFAGVCWQYEPGKEPSRLAIGPHASRVRWLRFEAARARGLCWARHQTEKLWRGEEYTLQIDCHSRFAPGWDVSLFAQLAACRSPKPVLSASPAGYTPPHDLYPDPKPSVRCARPFDRSGGLRFWARGLGRAPAEPLRGAFVAGGFIFSSSKVMVEVPYDPHLYFSQDEASYSLRLFTHGWDVFHPTEMPLYHLYASSGVPRTFHWRDQVDWGRLDQLSRARFDHLTGFQNSADSRITRELARFGLGKQRSLDALRELSGVDFRLKETAERARTGAFIEGLDECNPSGAARMAASKDEPRAPRNCASESGPIPTGRPGSSQERIVASPKVLPRKRRGRVLAARPLGSGLVPGRFVPFFWLKNHESKKREMQAFGGRPCALVLLPDERDDTFEHVIGAFAREAGELASRLIFISPGAPSRLAEQLERRPRTLNVWSDPDGKVPPMLGGDRRSVAHSLLLSENLRMLRSYDQADMGEQAKLLVRDLRSAIRSTQRITIARQAPVLLVPHVLTPEQCERVIAYHDEGRRFDGKVGVGQGRRVDKRNKIRTDCLVSDPLRGEIDGWLAETLYPEVEKVFRFSVSYREEYKVGCYHADEGGFFRSHRDNFDAKLVYRHCALSLNLNSDFEGGELVFPEYDGVRYRPETGGAVVFPCSLMHQVEKMHSGRRFVLVSFLYGAADVERQQRTSRAGYHSCTRKQRECAVVAPSMGHAGA